MTDIAILAAFVVAPLSGLVMFWLALRFLWQVYKRGGAADLAEAAASLLLARGIQPSGRIRKVTSHSDREQPHLRQEKAGDEARAPE
jgi:hypothetical protein